MATSLEKEENLESSWILLVALLSGQPCPFALRQRLAKISERVTWDSLAGKEETRLGVLTVLGSHAWDLGGENLATYFQHQIAQSAGALQTALMSRRHVAPTIRGARSSRGARAMRPAPDAARFFSQTLIMCFNEWPELANALPGAPAHFLLLPESQLANVWPLILRLRHDSDPYRRPTPAIVAALKDAVNGALED